jgi:hypothetical protein
MRAEGRPPFYLQSLLRIITKISLTCLYVKQEDQVKTSLKCTFQSLLVTILTI